MILRRYPRRNSYCWNFTVGPLLVVWGRSYSWSPWMIRVMRVGKRRAGEQP